jgi:hypothetical protein
VRKICKSVSSSSSSSSSAETSSEEPEATERDLSAESSSQPTESQTATVAPQTMTEEELVRQVGELVRVNSRVSGKAPLDPPELKRHERLEKIRDLVDDAKKKAHPTRQRKRSVGPCSTS